MINELMFLIVTLLSLLTVLLFTRLGREWLMMLPIALLILANIFAPQMVLAFGMVTSLGLPLYASIYLATDIISEHWGKRAAHKVVWIGLATQAVLLVMSWLIVQVEVMPFSAGLNAALKTVFAMTPRIVLGSLIAYIISQHWDVWVFHRLKDKTKGRHVWLRNNASTISSQLIDTTIFMVLAFYGAVPNFFQFLVGVWVLKVFVALVDTPFMYLSRHFVKKDEVRRYLKIESV
ncbi:queuosine precursor transporter [Candidatus Woesearchaeota archaeon]|nr:queuosine precursor transporter [Candidatus Woesearchaeota archaeon]